MEEHRGAPPPPPPPPPPLQRTASSETGSFRSALAFSSFYVKRSEFPPSLVLPASVHAAAAVDIAARWPYDFALEKEVTRQWRNLEKQQRIAEETAARAEADRIAEAKAEADRVAAAKAAEEARAAQEREAQERREAEAAAAVRAAEEEAERKRAESVSQMHNMTSADEGTCRRLLSASGGNVQHAIQAFYNELEVEAKRAARAAEEVESEWVAAEERTRREERLHQEEKDRRLAELLKRQGSVDAKDSSLPPADPGGADDSASRPFPAVAGIQPIHDPFGVANPFVDANPFTDSPTSRDFPPPSYPQPPSYGASDVPPPRYGRDGMSSSRPPQPVSADSSFPEVRQNKVLQLMGLTQKSEAACRHMLSQSDDDVARATDAFLNGEYSGWS